MAPVLETRSLDKRFGGIVAANAISLAIEKGARHALIGPNGAGKTTFVNLLTGLLLVAIVLVGRERISGWVYLVERQIARALRRPAPTSPADQGL